MKFFLPSLIFFIVAFISCVYASPAPFSRDVATIADEPLLANTHKLAERSLKYPLKCNDALVKKIMASVKADLYVKVFGSITGTFCEQTGASIKVKADLFSGIIKVGDARLKAVQSGAIKNLKANFDADLRAQVQASIYDQLEISLKKSLGSSIINQAKLLSIITKFEAKAKAVVKVQLPRIGAALTFKAKKHIDATINDVEFNLPLVAHITLSANVNEKATINTTIKVALKACAKLDTKTSALVILKSL